MAAPSFHVHLFKKEARVLHSFVRLSASTYSDLVDENEAVFPHHLLPFQIQVESWLGLGLCARLGLIFSAGRSLPERLGQRHSGRVFTWQVAHLAHQGGLDVYVGAELAHPLWKRNKTTLVSMNEMPSKHVPNLTRIASVADCFIQILKCRVH